MAKRFQDLETWQKARQLTRMIYACSNQRPWLSDRALQNQIRRSAVSVMANIAEGFERGSNTEFAQFLYISKGSLAEVRSHLCVAVDQEYLTQKQYDEIETHCGALAQQLSKFVMYLNSTKREGTKRLSTTKTISTQRTVHGEL